MTVMADEVTVKKSARGEKLILPVGATVFQRTGNPACWRNPHRRIITVWKKQRETYVPSVGVVNEGYWRIFWKTKKGETQWARSGEMEPVGPLDELASLAWKGGRRK